MTRYELNQAVQPILDALEGYDKFSYNKTFLHLIVGLLGIGVGVYLIHRKSDTTKSDVVGSVLLILVGVGEIAWITFIILSRLFPFGVASASVLSHGFGISI